MFSHRLLRHFLNDLEVDPVAPIITDITFVFTFHMHCFYCKVFIFYNILSFFLATFLSPITAACISIRVPFFVIIVIVIIIVPVVVVVVTVVIIIVVTVVVVVIIIVVTGSLIPNIPYSPSSSNYGPGYHNCH